MSSYTSNLNLLKKDPTVDGNDTFNIKTMLNDNWDTIDDYVAKRKKTVVYIEESQNWTVPSGITKIDVFIVDGGYAGGDSSKATSTSNYSSSAGAGGDAGAVAYIQDLTVTSGAVYTVVVGAANGGKSKFGHLYTTNSAAKGGSSASTQQDYRLGNVPVVQGLYGFVCPIDGKLYGVSGAAGGKAWTENSSAYDEQDLKAGGNAGKLNPDKRPAWGSTCNGSGYSSIKSKSYVYGGGGGASYDESGENGTAAILEDAYSTNIGGAGGNATTYGCGGGGAGGDGAIGGTGAQGAVIIAY